MKKIVLAFMLLFFAASAAEKPTLYKRLGGYETIAALLDDFHVRLKKDAQLGRFWKYRGTDGKERVATSYRFCVRKYGWAYALLWARYGENT
jgi:hypothetical protein